MMIQSKNVFFTLFVGFFLGNISGYFLWHSTESIGHMTLPDGAKGNMSVVSDSKAIIDRYAIDEFIESSKQSECHSDSVAAIENNPIDSVPPEARQLLESPPPHVTDPYFFGTDQDDPELIRLREAAATDYIQSLQAIGAPQEDIQAALDEFSLIHQDYTVSQNPTDSEPVPLEQQVQSLIDSLREAGEAEDIIQEQAEELGRIMNQQAGTDMQYSDGLGHLSPE